MGLCLDCCLPARLSQPQEACRITLCMQDMTASYLNSQSLNVIRPVSPAREVREVELDLVPAIVQPHGHGADEGLHSCCALVVTRPEAPPYVLVIEHLGQGRQAADTEVGLSAPSRPPHWSLDPALLTCTSKVKYFFRFLMIITRKGSLMPRVFFGSAGHVMYVVLRKAERGFRISHGTKHAVRVPSLSLDLIPEDR